MSGSDWAFLVFIGIPVSSLFIAFVWSMVIPFVFLFTHKELEYEVTFTPDRAYNWWWVACLDEDEGSGRSDNRATVFWQIGKWGRNAYRGRHAVMRRTQPCVVCSRPSMITMQWCSAEHAEAYREAVSELRRGA